MSDAGHIWKMLPHVSRCCYARVLETSSSGYVHRTHRELAVTSWTLFGG